MNCMGVVDLKAEPGATLIEQMATNAMSEQTNAITIKAIVS